MADEPGRRPHGPSDEARTAGDSLRISIERLDVSAYRIPTDHPESDGTIEWDSTTMVLVEARAGGVCGIGYSYAPVAAAALIRDMLAATVVALPASQVPLAWRAMTDAVRNAGRPGIASEAISAVDNALWDLKARLLDVPLVELLGGARDGVPIYGSGGFTSYTDEQLEEQLGGWARRGIRSVKMKVGRDPPRDVARVAAARKAVGPDVALYVDANGAYTRKQALWFADAFAELGVVWFEEPVPHSDLDGLRLMRDRAPAGMDVASGEYGYDILYFRRMIGAGAVDVVQADATRCGGITGFLQVAPLCLAHDLPLSAHTSPALHVHPCCAALPARNIEYFHDHVRIERMLFDGAPEPVGGQLFPDLTRPGNGLELRRAEAERYRVFPVT